MSRRPARESASQAGAAGAAAGGDARTGCRHPHPQGAAAVAAGAMAGPFTSSQCLVCGRDNPIGLHLGFWAGPSGSEAVWTPGAGYCGIPGVLHGGIVLALLDDAMWYAAYGGGGFTMTADAAIRYRLPVRTGQAVRVRGRIRDHRGRLWRAEAEIRAAGDGTLLAEAEGRFLAVAPTDVGLDPGAAPDLPG